MTTNEKNLGNNSDFNNKKLENRDKNADEVGVTSNQPVEEQIKYSTGRSHFSTTIMTGPDHWPFKLWENEEYCIRPRQLRSQF